MPLVAALAEMVKVPEVSILIACPTAPTFPANDVSEMVPAVRVPVVLVILFVPLAVMFIDPVDEVPADTEPDKVTFDAPPDVILMFAGPV